MQDFADPNNIHNVSLSPHQIKLLQGNASVQFFSVFLAIVLANLLSAVILFFSFRYYVKWSIEDSVEKIQQNFEKRDVHRK